MFEPGAESRDRSLSCVLVSSCRLVGVSSHQIPQVSELMELEDGFLPPGLSLYCTVVSPLTPLEDCPGTGKAAVVAFALEDVPF